MNNCIRFPLLIILAMATQCSAQEESEATRKTLSCGNWESFEKSEQFPI